MMGLVGTTYAISAVLGPLINDAITDKVSWKCCWYINLPVVGVVALTLFSFLHLPAAAAPPAIPWTQKLLHLDLVGIALAMGGITSFALALQYGGSNHPWGISIVDDLLVGSALIFGVLLVWRIWLGEDATRRRKMPGISSLFATAVMLHFFVFPVPKMGGVP
jgi:MFS family permease